MPLFSDKDNKCFKFLMRLWGRYNDRFVRISRLMPRYTSKQLSNHWRNYLNPNLCNQPLGDHEKGYVIELAQKYRTPKYIKWKYVIQDLYVQFGKLYAENKVKNYWNSKNRSNSYDVNDTSLRLPQLHNDTKYRYEFIMERNYKLKPKFNEPYRMRPY
ncbi:unnamed protein product [Rhizophagus irregularis]|nr:unnamed protein product [Rhizophagus irregularis]